MTRRWQRGTRRRCHAITAATLVGTVLEWYDFTLYGQAAALVFAGQFFPSEESGVFAALATYAVGYVARPVVSLRLLQGAGAGAEYAGPC